MTLDDPENLSATVASATSDQRIPSAAGSRRLQPPTAPLESASPDNDPNHGRNFILVSTFQIILRIGWIFKTESIIMPAVLDVIGGAGWLRGCLPMLNRFGQSIPPLLVSDVVRNSRRKKIGLAMTTMIMGVCFLALSWIWAMTGGQKSWWLPVVFLAIYGIFFSATGINQLFFNTISGKLIKFNFRGRLALVSTVIGATSAVILCLVSVANLVGRQRNRSGRRRAANFTMIFGFTGCRFCFGGTGVIDVSGNRGFRFAKNAFRAGVAPFVGLDHRKRSQFSYAHDHRCIVWNVLDIVPALPGVGTRAIVVSV